MRGLYLAEGTMLVQQARLQVISNNLANLRSAGFKRDQAVETSFAEWLVHELRPTIDVGGGRVLRPVGTIAHNVATQETVTSFEQGPPEVTGRPLDFAILGNGFFEVEGEDDVLYTRNGRFFLDDEGFLVTIEGYRVLGEGGPIQLETDQVTANADGALFVDGEEVGALSIVVFDEDALIEKYGYNYFTSEGPEGGEEEFRVVSGFIEGSNVDLVREMANLMMVRRTYEAAQKVMITYDQILDRAANDLGTLA